MKSDSCTSESFDKDLHFSSSKSEDKVKCGFFLDIIIGKSSAIFKLFSGENKSLLVWRDSFFILDLLFDVFD